jgi:hypothetical protein
MKTTQLLICAISLVAALAAAKTNAQSIPATLVDINPVLSVNGTFNNGSFIQNYPSGVLNFTEFDAFCVEPLQSISYGESLIYQVQDISQLGNSNTIARLIGGYLASTQSAQEAAAVQWAIWEITTESLSSPSLLNGNVRITTPISQSTADLANTYLANVNNFSPVALTYLTHSDRQNVVSWNVVPEPGSLMLAAFSGLLLLRRKR